MLVDIQNNYVYCACTKQITTLTWLHFLWNYKILKLQFCMVWNLNTWIYSLKGFQYNIQQCFATVNWCFLLQIYPFPMDDVLQDMLRRTINWDHSCKDTFTSTLHKQRLNNANVHDARSTLLLSKPPEMPPRPVWSCS